MLSGWWVASVAFTTWTRGQQFESLSECELSAQQETQLRDISAGCRSVLEKLEQTLAKYVELDSANGILKTRAKKAWRRLQWEPDEIRELRGSITAHLTLLNAFLGGIFRYLPTFDSLAVGSLGARY